MAPNLSRTDHRRLKEELNDLLKSLSLPSEERLLEVINYFIEYTPIQPPSTSNTESAIPYKSISQRPDSIILIWFHHLLSTAKRKAILAFQSVRGISKPGYPGILVLQGSRNVLDVTVADLKVMRWQAMQVRGEIEGHEKYLDEGIREVETVAEVVEEMESLGLRDWCLSALRMK